MSISTERGDGGQTSLIGGVRVSKADSRVEAYGTIDELISKLGFARALCRNESICAQTKSIQRELFQVGSAIATTADSRKPEPDITDEMVDRLTDEVHRIEAIEGLLADWSLPGEDPVSAVFDIARTVCRRAERLTVRLTQENTALQPNVLRYLNRLSDLLWLFGRQIEVEQGVDSRLREASHEGPRWSRAW
ncbi:MAG TPA: cob(I)yrinic acid a,c-diamide adenosyltransferase [Terriglobia bacterium]|nr:cob(I)yrinic acid a,c-diamide adenosyltransferase [Terriglobia bacterium]